MKNKILGVVIIMILGVMLLILTGCGDSEFIKELKQSNFVYLGKETEYTWDQATKAMMKNIQWSEYTENNYDYVMIEGTEKSTGKHIEIIYQVQSGGNLMRTAVNVDDKKHYDTYFDDLFKDLVEE